MIAKVRSIQVHICSVVLCVLSLSPAFGAVNQSVNGIFVLTNAKKGVPPQIYSNPNVDGISLRYFWSEIEPQAGVFNWARIDADVNQARRYGKKVSLSIVPGAHTPPWVYAAGAAPFPIIWNRRNFGGFPECSQQRIPIPWDRSYLAQWENFVQQLGQRYSSNPAVVIVWLTGINTYSEETNLVHTPNKNVPAIVACPNMPNYEAQWGQAGYSSDKVLSAWMSIVNAFARSFPQQRFVASVTPDGFPVVGNGSSFAENNNANLGSMYGMGRRGAGMGRGGMKREALELAREMNKDAVNRYGSRIIVMNDSLSAFHVWRPKSDLAGASIAYQMLWSVSKDRECKMNHRIAPCDPGTVLGKALDNGINAGASYIEVYAVDVLNPSLQRVLADARSRMLARPNVPTGSGF
jgi:hypothetical protein